tara:strand:- start:404 stop:523 length:120 start_codon:yes stop_codon:yes gene_type:complete
VILAIFINEEKLLEKFALAENPDKKIAIKEAINSFFIVV